MFSVDVLQPGPSLCFLLCSPTANIQGFFRLVIAVELPLSDCKLSCNLLTALGFPSHVLWVLSHFLLLSASLGVVQLPHACFYQ